MDSESIDISFGELLRILKNAKLLIIGTVFIATLLAIIVSLKLPVKYKAEAEIMPLITRRSADMPLSSLLGGLIPGGGIGTNSAVTQLVVLLKSQTLAEAILDKLDLRPKLFPSAWDQKLHVWKSDGPPPTTQQSVAALQGLVFIEDSKIRQTIRVAVTMTDPALAALIANTYLEELKTLVNKNAFTVSKKNRMFIEAQMQKNKREYFDNGMKLSRFYHKGISSIDSMIDIEMEDESLPTEREDNLHIAEPATAEKSVDASPVKTQKVSQQFYLQYLNMQQQVLNQLNNQLHSQFEMAKIEEAKDDLAFQVVDHARIPERKVSPKRTLIVAATFFLSWVFAISVVFLRHFFKPAPKVPSQVRGDIVQEGPCPTHSS